MSNIKENLQKLINTKSNIRNSIINKGVEVPIYEKMENYYNYIDNISNEYNNKSEIVDVIFDNPIEYENSTSVDVIFRIKSNGGVIDNNNFIIEIKQSKTINWTQITDFTITDNTDITTQHGFDKIVTSTLTNLVYKNYYDEILGGLKENDNRYEIRCSIDNIIYSEPKTYITGWGKYFDNIFESAPDILDTGEKKSQILVTISPTIDLSSIQGNNYYVTSDGYSGVAKNHTFDTNYDISIYTQNGYIKRKVKYIIVYKVDNNEISSINVNKCIYLYINNVSIGAIYNSQAYSYIENVRFGSNVTFVENSYFGFNSCCNLESIIIPNNLTQVDMFKYCYSLKSIIIPSTINILGDDCFKYCYSIESVNIPNTITNIGENTFSICSSLKSIVLPNNVINFYSTLYGCSNLKNVVIPTTTETLDSTFEECTNLESVYIPDNVKSMESTFYDCYKLKNVNIPNYHLLELDDTFWNCYCLEKIHIPNNLTFEIHRNPFDSCFSLYDISIDNGRSESLVIEYQNQSGPSFILSLDSIINIIYNLGNVSGKTLTIGINYINMLPNEIKEIATNKGWILN